MTFVTRIAGAAALGTAMAIGCGLLAPPTWAGYVVTLEQQGTSVVATGSGPLDLTGLTSTGTGRDAAQVTPSLGVIITGPAFPDMVTTDDYGVFTGPSLFGSGGGALASSGNGDTVAIIFGSHLDVPSGYVSGAPLSDTATYDNATFASLGVTPGSYEWTWGTGPNQNFTLDIVAPAVSEPSALAELAAGLGGLALAGFWRRRRRT